MAIFPKLGVTGVAGSKPIHLYNILEILCKRKGIDVPYGASYRDYKYNGYTNQKTLGFYLKDNFSMYEIENAHEEVLALYRRKGENYSAHIRGRPAGARGKKNRLDIYTFNEASAFNEASTFNEASILSNVDVAIEAKIAPQPIYALKDELYKLSAQINRCESHNEKHFIFENQIEALQKEIKEINLAKPTIIELKRPLLPLVNLDGVHHFRFPSLLKKCIAELRSGSHLNVWVYGPKGSGKTTAAENICKVLYGDMSRHYYNGSLASSFEVRGFNGANGQYVTTAFRQAWENGGVYLFDEIDGSMPDALLALNGALANGIASFPDKMVPRHKECIIIAGANTTGLGGTVEYVGRFKQDAALTDRFVYHDWPHDNALEDALCANKDWLAIVRSVREKCQAVKYKGQVPSMRASIYGESLLAAGLDTEEVIDSVIRKGVDDNTWATIKPSTPATYGSSLK